MSFSALDLSVSDNDTVEIGGRPASVPLQNADRVASRMVDYFATCVAPCRTLPGEQMRGDVTEATRYCLALVAEMFDRRAVPDESAFAEFRSVAARWAREGVPLGTILRAYHEGIRFAFGLVTAPAVATDIPELLDATDLILELLEAITTAVSDAYVEEQQLVAREHQTATQTLASALLSGRAHAALALQSGMPVAERYQVAALSIPPHPDELDTRVDRRVAARRKLRRVQSELAIVFDGKALALLSPQGGTLLIPLDGDAELTDDVLVRLSAAAEVPVTAAMVVSATAEVPEAADQAHELLGLVRAGERAPGLYQMTDLAVEYQLTRGGPATRRLATILAPLDDHPELFATMRAYLRNDMNRQLTARQLYVHPNTVDYRLRRIAQLTTIDLATSAGISQASIALLARELDRGPAGRP
ncbi:PucR family transcriptional regulator [Nocardia cyriacigeorgica]|uniref:PucR family transcriptional regulator n=1 Tax=Nocardia cyriacigeorgica TaxID=135487 RepID=UPI0018956935|nr:helix-turn-helix domain-containing protein [Nocardia cyriacigeorgica]MBF6435027.1 helix-turn-helix domain-containing protein [Nocardia cyriacigeorgica]MBF6454894.1 helix-turn-helix domain-containing protein [Nocardia cyriacigeorgica]MBF6479739.1 helix-turn-helix domain-containing protein [Nocardia cyriacigeorgica]MBF6552789.1 helix-turn-helix domain-containing protein [Nocardia cyriacigeorgica]